MSADESKPPAQVSPGWRYAIFGLAIAAGIVRNGYRRYQENGTLDAGWFAIAAAVSVVFGMVIFLVCRLMDRPRSGADSVVVDEVTSPRKEQDS